VAVLVLRLRPRVLLELQRRQHLAAVAAAGGGGAGAGVAAVGDESLKPGIFLREAVGYGNVQQEGQQIPNAVDILAGRRRGALLRLLHRSRMVALLLLRRRRDLPLRGRR